MPPIINDITAAVNAKNQSNVDSKQLSTLSRLMQSIESESKISSNTSVSNTKLNKNIENLNKNIASLVKNNFTSSRYSAGFDKTLHTFDPKNIAKAIGKGTDMSETNKLLKALLGKKNEVTIKGNEKDGGGFDLLGSLGGLGDALKAAGLAAILTKIFADAFSDPNVRKAFSDLVKQAGKDAVQTAPAALKLLPEITGKILTKIPIIGDLVKGGGALVKGGITSAKIAVDKAATQAAVHAAEAPKYFMAAEKLVKAKTISAAELAFKELDASRAALKAAGIVSGSMAHGASAFLNNPITAKIGEKALVAAGKFGSRAIPFAGAAVSGYAATDDALKGNKLGASLNAYAAGADIASLVQVAAPTGVSQATGGITKVTGLLASLGAVGSEIYWDITHPESKNEGVFGKKPGVQATLEDLSKLLILKDQFVDVKDLDNTFKQKFVNMIAEYNQPVHINSAFRTKAEQQILYDNYMAGKGPMAAPPGRSEHETGKAVDIDTADINNLEKLGLLKKYGFNRKVDGEGWHLTALAKGGITNGPTTALIGEAGKEAVIPLESDEGIAALAESMGKYNMNEGSNKILSQILKAVSSNGILSTLLEINKNLQNSSSMVSISGNLNTGVAS